MEPRRVFLLRVLKTRGDSGELSPEPLKPVFSFQGKPDKLKLLMIKHSFRKYLTYFSLIYFLFGLRSVARRSLELLFCLMLLFNPNPSQVLAACCPSSANWPSPSYQPPLLHTPVHCSLQHICMNKKKRINSHMTSQCCSQLKYLLA